MRAASHVYQAEASGRMYRGEHMTGHSLIVRERGAWLEDQWRECDNCKDLELQLQLSSFGIPNFCKEK